MTDTSHAITAERINPRELILDANVRKLPRLDPDFVESIRTIGVVVPVVAYRDAEGRVMVRMGQRRVLAAVDTGRPDVPVFIYDSADAADDAARIIAQHAENTHRAGLTAAEETGVVTTLFDLGMTADEISGWTRMPRPRVDQAAAIARSAIARKAAERYEFLNLDQAAAIAEFDGDKDAVKALTAAARTGDGEFAHVLQTARDDRAEEQQRSQVLADLAAAGVTVVGDRPGYEHMLYKFDAGDGKEMTPGRHASCPGHVAFLERTWSGEARAWVPQYYCADPTLHRKHGQPPKAADMEPAEREAARAERREVIDNNRSWKTATTVRRDWLRELAGRAKPPAGGLRFLLESAARGDYASTSSAGRYNELGCELTGHPEAGRDDIAAVIAKASDQRAQVLALVMILAAYEVALQFGTWRSVWPAGRRYLEAIEGFGYTLAPVEQLAAGRKPPAAAAEASADE